jgi:hypothetical protein
MKEWKERTKSKSKFKPYSNQQDASNFIPFEATGSGSGYGSNVPLSMHSEMMAIQSALSLSSGALCGQTSARSAKYLKKPRFSLQGDSKKRKDRARGLKAYAEAVCSEAATATGKFSLQEQGFGAGASQSGTQGEKCDQLHGNSNCHSREGNAVRGVEDGEQY